MPDSAHEQAKFGQYSDDVADVELENERGTASFAAWLRAARIGAGWTKGDALSAVASAGVAERTYSHYESGTIAKPDPATVRRICHALGLDPRRAAVALGILTEEELELPPEPPTPPTTIRNILTILHMLDVSDELKVLLLRHVQASVDMWSDLTGVRQPVRDAKPAQKRPTKR